ncbi:MAG: prephenate dehydratase [Halothiobacillaceae bacterium]|nr:prephenate dehydratase [Halothiobacillaceae bacterium]
MSEREALSRVRARIDAIDSEILRLISDRARCAIEVGEIKRAAGDAGSFYRPEREAQVLTRVREQNPGPLSGESVAWLFRELMSACLALEQPLSIAFLGPEGSFTHMAVTRAFGHAARGLPAVDMAGVLREVEAGNADFGVLPIENSTEGSVGQTLDALVDSDLTLCGEVELRVHQQLMSHAGELSAVRKVLSHAQSLAQCRHWLDRHLPGVERLAVSSNSEAARLVAEDATLAAIGPALAAQRYGLPILVPNIEDSPHNATRFVVVGREAVAPSGEDKTSLVLSTHNLPGALYALLQPLAERGIGMTRIESRPARARAWEYLFFVDLEGHRDDPALAEALSVMSARASMLRVLGSYPRARL